MRLLAGGRRSIYYLALDIPDSSKGRDVTLNVYQSRAQLLHFPFGPFRSVQLLPAISLYAVQRESILFLEFLANLRSP